jgi:hypothetical protein
MYRMGMKIAIGKCGAGEATLKTTEVDAFSARRLIPALPNMEYGATRTPERETTLQGINDNNDNTPV